MYVSVYISVCGLYTACWCFRPLHLDCTVIWLQFGQDQSDKQQKQRVMILVEVLQRIDGSFSFLKNSAFLKIVIQWTDCDQVMLALPYGYTSTLLSVYRAHSTTPIHTNQIIQFVMCVSFLFPFIQTMCARILSLFVRMVEFLTFVLFFCLFPHRIPFYCERKRRHFIYDLLRYII